MLTFSRAAATEFKQRLMGLIGNAAHFVEIKTFHSYCFDLLGRIGNLEDAKDVVSRAAQMINNGEVEPNRIAKTVLVIDEAQDMSKEEYDLVNALMLANEEMRVIAVGDDDQNIFEFRRSNSKFMAQLCKEFNGTIIEMTENYRSSQHIVKYANHFVNSIKNRMKNQPIISMSSNIGSVSITLHTSAYMYQPVVNELIKHCGQGTTCILTQTNEEAVIMVALLRKHKIKSKLIQAMEGFRFWHMAEVRFLLKCIEADIKTPLIPKQVWDKSKQLTFTKYADSASLCYLQQCIKLFEDTNQAKYLTDFKEYIFESSAEDFCDLSNADIVVSTIHKSKGMEFDNVYMLITNPLQFTNEVLRKYYVGITRAKQRLFIHTNSSIFDNSSIAQKRIESTLYEMPNEIVLQLSHKDVNLGYFKFHKNEILALRAGQKLHYKDGYLLDIKTKKPVCQLSQHMMSKLCAWNEKNYFVSDVSIRFIVAWRPKDAPKEEKEHAILLVDLTLNKHINKENE
jgi:ATP-dependent DNA helicase RecQ